MRRFTDFDQLRYCELSDSKAKTLQFDLFHSRNSLKLIASDTGKNYSGRHGKTRSSYWQLLPYIRPQSKTIAQALACTLVFGVFWPVLAWLDGRIAGYIGQGNVGAIAQLAGLSAVVFLIRVVRYGQDAQMAKAALAIALDLRKQAYAHSQLNLSYFETAKTGDLSHRLTEDIDRVGEVVNKVFHQFVPCICN